MDFDLKFMLVDVIILNMNILENNSYCGIKKKFALSSCDMEVMTFLYLPIIGSDAFSLYLSLYRYYDLIKQIAYFSHEDLFEYLQMENSKFLFARIKLEGIGLLEVFRKESLDQQSKSKVTYIYRLLPPASPKKFFADILLRSLLNNAIGNKKYFLLASYFQIQENDVDDDFVNVTTPFKNVFTMDVKEGDVSLHPIVGSLEEKKYKSQYSFDKKLFKKKLKDIQYSFDIIKPYMKEIENLFVLYNVNIDDMVKLIVDNTDTDGGFYLESLKKDVRSLKKFSAPEKNQNPTDISGNGEFAKLIACFNELSPEDYLSIRYNCKPAKYMYDEIEHLKNDLNFTNPIINVVLDYCLRQTKNEFNTIYIDKVAYTLSSLNVSDAFDAMTKLNNRDFEATQNRRKKKSNKNMKTNKDSLDEQEETNDIDIAKFNEEFSI